MFELLWNATEGKLKKTKVVTSGKTAVSVVLASEGYPNKYKKGMKIEGLDKLKDELIFHAGTKQEGHHIVTNGGRVLNVVGIGESLSAAIKEAYRIVGLVEFENKFYRNDIGLRGMRVNKKGA